MTRLPRKENAARRPGRLLLALPAAMTLGSAVNHDPELRAFALPINPDLDRRIEAYRPLMELSQPLTRSRRSLTEEDAHRLADQWTRAAERGDLKPLPPLFEGDDLMSGATGQILRTQRRIAVTLLQAGEARLSKGDRSGATKNFLLAGRVILPTLYSDVDTLGTHSQFIRRALLGMERAAKQATVAERFKIVQMAKSLEPGEHFLADLGWEMWRMHEASAKRASEGYRGGYGYLPNASGATDLNVGRAKMAEAANRPEGGGLASEFARAESSDAATRRRIAKIEQIVSERGS